MKSQLIDKTPKTFVVVFDSGDQVIDGLNRFARQNGLGASRFTATSVFEEVTLGFFNVRLDGRRDDSTATQLPLSNT